jgi:hypothetical protein
VEEVLGRERKPRSLHLTVWEAEEAFLERLRQVLEECVAAGRAAGVPTACSVDRGDLSLGDALQGSGRGLQFLGTDVGTELVFEFHLTQRGILLQARAPAEGV